MNLKITGLDEYSATRLISKCEFFINSCDYVYVESNLAGDVTEIRFLRSCDFKQTKAYVYYQARRHKKLVCKNGFKAKTEDGEVRYHEIGSDGHKLSSIKEHTGTNEINFLGETLTVDTVIDIILSIADVNNNENKKKKG